MWAKISFDGKVLGQTPFIGSFKSMAQKNITILFADGFEVTLKVF